MAQLRGRRHPQVGEARGFVGWLAKAGSWRAGWAALTAALAQSIRLTTDIPASSRRSSVACAFGRAFPVGRLDRDLRPT